MDPNRKFTRRDALRLAAFTGGAAVASGCRGIPPASAETPRSLVEVVRAPDGALQPQAVIDGAGVVHLIYLKGEPRACDVFYARREAVNAPWSAPLRVNHLPATAIAAGSIRGAQVALGQDNRVHVVWNGSDGHNSPTGAPLYYAHLAPGTAAFSQQRDLLGKTADLDGGASVAADPKGNVYVAWHAAPSRAAGEAARRVWLARSSDGGRTFAPETGVYEDPTGACACCSVKIFADSKGVVYLLYRAATEKVNRDMVFLTSTDGRIFRGGRIDPWVINACPMSSESFAEGAGGVWGAWETGGQVRFAQAERSGGKLGRHISAPGAANGRKHPFLAANRRGQVLLVWDEGTGWQRGGALAWQLYTSEGAELPERGRMADGIPVWGLATAVALPDGRFLIVH